MQVTLFGWGLKWLLPPALVVSAAGSLWWHLRPETPQFVTADVARGNIERAIVATGALNPVATVQVGTYVSGVIQSLQCDYNTVVKAGQLCARIDPRPYQVVVDQSVANLAGAQAQLRKDQAALAFSRVILARDLKLQKSGGVAQETVDTDKSNVDEGDAQVGLDEANVEQRAAALDAARVNLGYTSIISPVDGVVVSRTIDVGQTVAASFQTPTLFLIAKDLTKMQVDTNVSESDVGGARVGEKAFFTVEAYPDKTFEGRVTQLRQAPITVQNVVTYDVVVSVDNPDLQLLPGMTANARIVTDEHDDVVRVPVEALRFSPKENVRQAQGAANGRVWLLRGSRPLPTPVTTGLTDGTAVEIVSGDLKSGDKVIVNEIRPDDRKPVAAPALSPLRL